jgi:hypothetical protein
MYRRYCRIAAVVFLVFTVYPIFTKLAGHRLAHDWAHSVLHFASALLAAYAGWLAPAWVARAFALGVTVLYGILGVAGWFIDGFFLGTAIAIPLGPVDHVFHLLLAVGAGATLLLAGAREAPLPPERQEQPATTL